MLLKKLFIICLLTTAGCLFFFSSCKFRQKVDMIIHHAKIYTVDEKFSVAEAMAIGSGQ